MKPKLKLILPNKKYVFSYIKMEREFQAEGNRTASGGMETMLSPKDFAIYNKKAVEKRKGINISKGKVPATLFWAAIGNKVVGRLSLRHRLWNEVGASHIGYAVKPSERKKGYGREILRLGLIQAKKLGIKKTILGCILENIPSSKIIQANGGKLIKKYKKDGVEELLFRIDNK